MKNHKGAIATLLTLGLVVVGTLITLGSSLFINNQKTNLASNSMAYVNCSGPKTCPNGKKYYQKGSAGDFFQYSGCTGEVNYNTYCIGGSAVPPPPSSNNGGTVACPYTSVVEAKSVCDPNGYTTLGCKLNTYKCKPATIVQPPDASGNDEGDYPADDSCCLIKCKNGNRTVTTYSSSLSQYDIPLSSCSGNSAYGGRLYLCSDINNYSCDTGSGIVDGPPPADGSDEGVGNNGQYSSSDEGYDPQGCSAKGYGNPEQVFNCCAQNGNFFGCMESPCNKNKTNGQALVACSDVPEPIEPDGGQVNGTLGNPCLSRRICITGLICSLENICVMQSTGGSVGSCTKKSCKSLDVRYPDKWYYEKNGKYYDANINNCTGNTNSMTFTALGQFCQSTIGEPFDRSCITQTGFSTAYCPNTVTGNCQPGFKKITTSTCGLLVKIGCCVPINANCVKKNCQSLDSRYDKATYYESNLTQYSDPACKVKLTEDVRIMCNNQGGLFRDGSSSDATCVNKTKEPLAYCPTAPFGVGGCNEKTGYVAHSTATCGASNKSCCVPKKGTESCVKKNCQDIDKRFDNSFYYTKNGKRYETIGDCGSNGPTIDDINIRCNANSQTDGGDKTCVEQTNDFLAYCPNNLWCADGFEKSSDAKCRFGTFRKCCIQKQQQVQEETTFEIGDYGVDEQGEYFVVEE